MITKERKQLLIVLWGFAPTILSMIPLIGFRKAPIIMDGDYLWIGALSVIASVFCFFSAGFFSFRNYGFHWYKVYWANQNSTFEKVKYAFKMTLAYVCWFIMMFYVARFWTMYSIESSDNNVAYKSTFKVERISCSSKTLCQLKSIKLYSYSHKDTFYLDFPKELITNSEVGTCIRLIGHRNKYGIYVENIQKGAICSPYLQ